MSAVMSFNDFKEYLRNAMRDDYELKDYKDANKVVFENKNSMYDPSHIQTQSIVNLREWYDTYIDNLEVYTMDDVVDHLYEFIDENCYKNTAVTRFKEMAFGNKDQFMGYIKERLVAFSQENTGDRPFERFLDMAVLYELRLVRDEGTYTMQIDDKFMKMHDLSVEEVKEAARLNRSGAKIRNMVDILINSLDIAPTDDAFWDMFNADGAPKMYVIMNDVKNGAAVLLDEEFLKSIGKKVNQNFYVLPSSVHEAIIVPADADMKGADELAMIVREINSTEISDKDKLTDSVYLYDHKAGKLTIAVPSPELEPDKTYRPKTI